MKSMLELNKSGKKLNPIEETSIYVLVSLYRERMTNKTNKILTTLGVTTHKTAITSVFKHPL